MEIRDVTELPYPEEKVEQACVHALRTVELAAALDSRVDAGRAYRNALALTLTNLSHYQSGVGQRLEHPVFGTSARYAAGGELKAKNLPIELLAKADTGPEGHKYHQL